MRNLGRLLAFDILAPLATIGALLMIGVILDWPLWWVSACSVLLVLIIEGVGANFWLLRRDSVSVGTDDDAPGLRLAVVLLCTIAFSGSLLAPQSSDLLRGIGALPIGIAEPVVGLWLLIRGIRIAPQAAQSVP